MTTTAYKGTPAPKLQVRSTKDLASAQAHILIYGKTKAGKTTTALTYETDPSKNGIICTQPQAQLQHMSKSDIPYVKVVDAAEFDLALRSLPELFPNATTIVVDDFTEAVTLKLQQAKKQTADGRQAYGIVSDWCSELLARIFELPYNFIFTAFEKGAAIDEINPIESLQPAFSDSTRNVLLSKMDFILYLEDYKLRVKPTATKRILVGNRWPKAKVSSLPETMEPDLSKLWALYQQALK